MSAIRFQRFWLGLAPLAALLGLSLLGLSLLAGPVSAEKIGVAAAVNPDAFSSLNGGQRSEIRIGKSIFYNERINTTGSGLVQVLLIDGSTFTVGPGSDLVIDKFVYDPKKKHGQVVATFSKGVLRFVGGKLSKNKGGVTVKTPAGTLTIRGGIFQGMVNGNSGIFSFLYGEELTFTSNNGRRYTVFQPGNTLVLAGGVPNIRPTTPADTQLFMAALTNGNTNGGNNRNNDNQGHTNTFQQTNTDNIGQLIKDANTVIVQTEILKQLHNNNNNNPPPPDNPDNPGPQTDGTFNGYAAGMEQRPEGNRQGAPFALKSGSSDDVFVNVDTEGPTVSAGFELNFEDNGRAVINFQEADDYPLTEESIALFDANNNPIELNSGSATLNRSGDLLCESCDFMQWGSWDAHLNYNDGTSTNSTNVFFSGWWVAGDITQDSDLPLRGSATYSGHVIGNVANNLDKGGWKTYVATGDLAMNWSFAARAGDLTISNFDGRAYSTNPDGQTPNQLTQPSLNINQFGGSLSQIAGPPIAGITGSATGSFVNNGAVKAAGVIGNWNVGSSAYKATGIFGGSGTPQIPAN